MKCLSCNTELGKPLQSWMKCERCEVIYLQYDCDPQYHHIKWERTIGDMEWALNIYPNQNYSVLVGNERKSEEPWMDGDFTEIKIDYAITDVSPKNIINKIKTIITFS